MARLTRHELKKDELGTRLSAGMDVFVKHQKKITRVGLIAAASIGLGLVIYLYVRSQQAQAAESFTKALESYHAPVVQTPPQGFTGVSFKTPEEKYQKALEQFTETAGQFSRYAAGRWARYYAALCQRELGKLAEAEKELQSLARQGSADFSALSKLALAGVYEQTNRAAEADKLLRELEDNPTRAVPKATAQIARADLHRKTNPSQASDLYQQIQKEYTGTAAGDLATERLEELAP